MAEANGREQIASAMGGGFMRDMREGHKGIEEQRAASGGGQKRAEEGRRGVGVHPAFMEASQAHEKGRQEKRTGNGGEERGSGRQSGWDEAACETGARGAKEGKG